MKTVYIVLTDTWCSIKATQESDLLAEKEEDKGLNLFSDSDEKIPEEKVDFDPIFTKDQATSLCLKYKVHWLIQAQNEEEAFLQECLFSKVMQLDVKPTVVIGDQKVTATENPGDCFFVASDFQWLFSRLKLDWSKVDKSNQLVYVSNSLGGVQRQLNSDKAFSDLNILVKAKIYSLYQLEAKLDFLVLLQQKPEIWDSGDIIKIGGSFQMKKFLKMIKQSGLFMDKPPFFYSTLDPYNESDFDMNIVLYKLTDDKAIERLEEAKRECEKIGKAILFPNPPELSASFRNRALNIQLMHKVIENAEFKSKFAEFALNHPEIRGKKILVPPTVIIKPDQVDQGYIEERLKEAGLKNSIIIKGEDGSDHRIALLRDLSRAAELIEKEFKGQEVLLQKVFPHGACCYKLYALLGEPFMNLRTSLDSKLIPAEGNAWYNILSDLSSQKFNITAMDSIYRLCLLNPEVAKFIVQEFCEVGNVWSFGLDLIVDDEKGDIYAIDLNDLPSFKDVDGDLPSLIEAYWKRFKPKFTTKN